MKVVAILGGLEHRLMWRGKSGITKGPPLESSSGFDLTDSIAATVKREKPLKVSLGMRRLLARSWTQG